MSESALEEFLAIVQRDLAAESVRVVDADGEPPADDVSLRCDLPGGRRLVAVFAGPPADVEARRRRLEMLVSAFGDTLFTDGRARVTRPPPARSLQEELAALAQRAGAVEVVVIDEFSPVVWGSADQLEDPASRLASLVPELRASPSNDETPVPGSAKPALYAVHTDDLAAAAQYGLASAQGLRIDPGAQRLVPRAVCAHHHLLPISRTGDRLVVAMADPRDADAIRDVILVTGLQVEPVYAGASMAAFFRHLDDDDGDTRTYEEVMAAIPAADRAAREPAASAAGADWARTILTRRAIAEVRELPETDGLHKGAQLRHTVSAGDFGYVARSFASIYIVIVIFDGTFDELLAKRALAHAMPTIERLVAALPPLDPPPHMGGVAALRPRRRR
ncbi:MAG: hypothetical protein QM820_54860 [Minicystis sp.]